MGDETEETRLTERLELPNGMTMRWVKSDGWYVGQIEEMPEAISQGSTLEHLIDMILDAKAMLNGEEERVEATFDRGLDEELVDALNGEYGKDGWWRKLIDDNDTFVAIRDNRVNVYYRGCSLAEVWLESGAVVGQTHYKYRLRPSVDAPYVRFEDGEYVPRGNASSLFVDSPTEVAALKAAARPFAGMEKTGVQQIISANPNILDVEIAFGLRGTEEGSSSAPRVDFAALRVTDDGAEVVFFEAKRFADRGALRASDGSLPKVVEQVEGYAKLLRDNREKVVECYQRVCSNLLSLRGMELRHQERHRVLERIAGTSLTIDPEPRLVIFGFDADQRDGSAWKPHRKRLIDLLGKERVLLKGDSKDFRSGISINWKGN